MVWPRARAAWMRRASRRARSSTSGAEVGRGARRRPGGRSPTRPPASRRSGPARGWASAAAGGPGRRRGRATRARQACSASAGKRGGAAAAAPVAGLQREADAAPGRWVAPRRLAGDRLRGRHRHGRGQGGVGRRERRREVDGDAEPRGGRDRLDAAVAGGAGRLVAVERLVEAHLDRCGGAAGQPGEAEGGECGGEEGGGGRLPGGAVGGRGAHAGRCFHAGRVGRKAGSVGCACGAAWRRGAGATIAVHMAVEAAQAIRRRGAGAGRRGAGWARAGHARRAHRARLRRRPAAAGLGHPLGPVHRQGREPGRRPALFAAFPDAAAYAARRAGGALAAHPLARALPQQGQGHRGGGPGHRGGARRDGCRGRAPGSRRCRASARRRPGWCWSTSAPSRPSRSTPTSGGWPGGSASRARRTRTASRRICGRSCRWSAGRSATSSWSGTGGAAARRRSPACERCPVAALCPRKGVKAAEPEVASGQGPAAARSGAGWRRAAAVGAVERRRGRGRAGRPRGW